MTVWPRSRLETSAAQVTKGALMRKEMWREVWSGLVTVYD